MSDEITQHKRNLELEYYREKLTELANDEDTFRWASNWAEEVLRHGEAITGPGVDITEDERELAEAAVARIAEWTQDEEDA